MYKNRDSLGELRVITSLNLKASFIYYSNDLNKKLKTNLNSFVLDANK